LAACILLPYTTLFRSLLRRRGELLAALIKLFQQPDASLVFFLRFDYFGQATREQSPIFARIEAALPRLPSFTRHAHFSQLPRSYSACVRTPRMKMRPVLQLIRMMSRYSFPLMLNTV